MPSPWAADASRAVCLQTVLQMKHWHKVLTLAISLRVTESTPRSQRHLREFAGHGQAKRRVSSAVDRAQAISFAGVAHTLSSAHRYRIEAMAAVRRGDARMKDLKREIPSRPLAGTRNTAPYRKGQKRAREATSWKHVKTAFDALVKRGKAEGNKAAVRAIEKLHPGSESKVHHLTASRPMDPQRLLSQEPFKREECFSRLLTARTCRNAASLCTKTSKCLPA